MSELVETALRLLLRSQRKREKIVALPSFRSGGALVDIADHESSTKPWKAGSARGRQQCTGFLRRRHRLAVSCPLPRLARAQRVRPDAWDTAWGYFTSFCTSRTQRQRMRRYEQIVGANGLAGSLETCSELSVFGIGGLLEGEHIDGTQDGVGLRCQP